MTDTPMQDSDITRDEPTEDDENLDQQGEGPRDTGDETSEGEDMPETVDPAQSQTQGQTQR